MGSATNMWQLTGLTAIVWFSGGMQLALINILAGLFAAEKERGKVFGVLTVAYPLGALAGGLAVGPMADRWGYPTMFAVVAVFWCIWPITGLLLEDKAVARVQAGEASTSGARPRLAGVFYLLLLASVATGVAGFVRGLGNSLMMNELGFSATAISGTAAVGGAVALPLPALVGWLSDRLSRKRLLALCYLAVAASLLALTVSESLWHFWVSTTLASVASAHSAVGSALVTDLVPQESLGRGLSLFGATSWVGGIIGYASTGHAIQQFGTSTTFILGASLPLLAVLLLRPIRKARREKAAIKTAPA
jgi:MFS family permease